MFSILLLLLVGAGVYVGWFHKFDLEDGSQVKGWVAKYKAEHNANPLDNPKEALDDIVATAKKSKTVEAAVQKAKDLKGKKSESDTIEEAPAEEVPEAGMAVEEAPREGIVANGSSRVPTEDNPSGLSITSTPLEFEEVLQEAQADPFDKGWGLMQGYFGWLLLGASRHDWMNSDSIWTTMSNGCQYFKDGLKVDYQEMFEKGEIDEEQMRILPAWMVNSHLNNAIGFFAVRAKKYFSSEVWAEIGPRIEAWYDAYCEQRNNESSDDITDEPNASIWLAKLFTIFRHEPDEMVEYNLTEYFEKTSAFDVHLPEPST
ncbi:MAG: hypothetical protein IJS82_01885 [Paludibacteraceae bacterium]|nr:hypothetical protein [Paludibacteraceae bacterium]